MDRLAEQTSYQISSVCIIVFAARPRLPDEPGGGMHIGMAITIVAALAQAARAEQKLDVFINGGESIPFATLQSAKALASRMFTTADVRIAWHRGTRSGWKGRNRVLIIQMEMNTPTEFHPGALGSSLPFEGVHVSIFYDRI